MSRTYFLKDPIHPKGGIEITCTYNNDCVFCDHCTEVFWDYTNLIYAIGCEDDHDPCYRPCPYFKETKEDKNKKQIKKEDEE